MTETNNPAPAEEKPKKEGKRKLAMKEINPELFRHPGEAGALGRLEKAPGFAKLLDMMSDYGGKAERLVETASMARVGPGVYPLLHKVWQETLDNFGVGDIPLHVSFQDAKLWQIKGGGTGPRVIISSLALDELPKKEMQALLAMAAGSIRLGNVVNFAAAEFLRWFQDFSGIAGSPAMMLSWALENWRRYAAMSADRAAALACSHQPVQSLLLRVAGAGSGSWGGIADPGRLRLQGVEAASRDEDWDGGRWRRFASAMNRHNSAALIRNLDLDEWVATGAPDLIVHGKVTTVEDLASACEECCGSGLAFWGAFAPGSADDSESGWRETAAEWREAAGKGITTFLRAGEAFYKTLREGADK